MTETTAWVESILKKHNQELSVVRVLSASETPFFPHAGECYLSYVTRLKFRMVRGDGTTVINSLVVKTLPKDSVTSLLVQESGANFLEFTMYRDVFPAMENLMIERGLTDEFLWPKCFAMRPYNKIVLEDLTTRGYKMCDRVTGLDFEHCTLVMQNLGLFHSLSLALKNNGVLSRMLFGKSVLDKNAHILNILVDEPFQNLLREMTEWGPEWSNVYVKLKNNEDIFRDRVIDSFKSNEYEVLVHTDCWTNNFLFKYDVYTGRPVQMKLLDYQSPTLANPVVDLVYFLVTTPNLEARPRSQELINVYYNSLVLNVKRLGVKPALQPTLEFIQNEYRRLIFLRLRTMIFHLPIFLEKDRSNTFSFADAIGGLRREKYDDDMVKIFKMILMEALEDGSL